MLKLTNKIKKTMFVNILGMSFCYFIKVFFGRSTGKSNAKEMVCSVSLQSTIMCLQDSTCSMINLLPHKNTPTLSSW